MKLKPSDCVFTVFKNTDSCHKGMTTEVSIADKSGDFDGEMRHVLGSNLPDYLKNTVEAYEGGWYINIPVNQVKQDLIDLGYTYKKNL